MISIARFSVTVFSLLCATAAWSADYKVKRSLELSSPPTETWHLIGDFCDIDDWHPNVVACSLRVLDGSVARRLTTDSGEQITQKRIASEPGLSYTYKTVSSSLPIENFTATVSIKRGDNSLIEWSANFSSDDIAMEQVVVEEIEAGLSSIEHILASR